MRDRILDYMREFGSITTMQAFKDLGCSRLSEYIRQIRLEHKVGYTIEKGVNRYGKKVKWMRFYLED